MCWGSISFLISNSALGTTLDTSAFHSPNLCLGADQQTSRFRCRFRLSCSRSPAATEDAPSTMARLSPFIASMDAETPTSPPGSWPNVDVMAGPTSSDDESKEAVESRIAHGVEKRVMERTVNADKRAAMLPAEICEQYVWSEWGDRKIVSWRCPSFWCLTVRILIAWLLQDTLSHGSSGIRISCSRQLVLARRITDSPSLRIPSFAMPFFLRQQQRRRRAIHGQQSSKAKKTVQSGDQA